VTAAEELGEHLAPSQRVIDFQGICKTFPDGTEALEDVSFGVGQGEFVAVVGPSGCGKSTLLRLASGLTPLSGGRIVRSVQELGYVFQDPTLLPWRTVRRNIELLGELAGMPKPERRKRAQDAIRLVGLDGFENHYPLALSGGMKMRVSLARGLTMRPRLFLLDEPFGALDEITRSGLNDELMSLFAAEKFAAIFITHSINEAVFLSSRVLVMGPRPGRIIAEVCVPAPYPRDPDFRFEREFSQLAEQVSHALREGYK
jgi:NitT/TauT family transport system ATP-binding protein